MSISHFDTSMKNRSRPEFNANWKFPRCRIPPQRHTSAEIAPAAECLKDLQSLWQSTTTQPREASWLGPAASQLPGRLPKPPGTLEKRTAAGPVMPAHSHHSLAADLSPVVPPMPNSPHQQRTIKLHRTQREHRSILKIAGRHTVNLQSLYAPAFTRQLDPMILPA